MAVECQAEEYDSNYGKQYAFPLKNQALGRVHSERVCVCVFQAAYSTEKQKQL